MKHLPLFLSLLFLSAAPGAFAQKKTLAIGPVEVNPAVVIATQQAGSALELARVTEAIDGELMNSFQQTRRFDLFARSDLSALLQEQNLAESGNLDLSDPNTAQSFQLGGAQYLVVTTLSDFQDYQETATFESIGKSVTKRIIRIGAIAKIYDTTTGKLLDSVRVATDESDFKDDPSYQSVASGVLSDDLLALLAQTTADRVATRVVDVLFPARIVGKVGKSVSINRGDGFDIKVGDVWKVFAEGEEMIDPDTGESLGSAQAEVGTIRIIEVLPRMSRAEIVEDYGIDTLQIVRPEK